jgi:chromatin modification-related protein YNG2
MDTAATLDQYTQDLSNLPAELQYLLAELGTSDNNLYEIRKKISQKDSTIHRFIKQHGSLTKNPKEIQLYPKIRDDFKSAEQLQREKVITANTALFLTAKHLVKLEADMEKLKSEGLLVVEDIDVDLDEMLLSSRTPSRAGTDALLPGDLLSSVSSATVASVTNTQKKAVRKSSSVKASTPASVVAMRPLKRQRTEGSKTPEPVDISPVVSSNVKVSKTQSPRMADNSKDDENELYCFCQRVSFGEMVGCDNDDCKFEWFHYECVGLKEPPKGKWYCPDCTERLKKEKKKRKN